MKTPQLRQYSYDEETWLNLAIQAEFRASVLARMIGISRRQLERYFQRHFGDSPQAWMNKQRIIKAAYELEYAESVKEVAYNLGFKQVSHFCREFKDFHGQTCTDYLSNQMRKMDDVA